MTVVTPTFQNVNPPTLTDVCDALKLDIKKTLNCVRPGVIQVFDAATQTCIVEIAQTQVTSIAQDGTRTIEAYSPLLVVPVVFPSGGGFTLTFPIQEGDECLLFFNDRQLDNWFAQGAGQAPTIGRLHDLSDAFALVGIRSSPRALAGVSTASVQLRSDNYTGATGAGECVEVSPGKIQLIADEVVIHARTKLVYDADGNGTVITSTHREDYVIGSTSHASNLNPPEVPS